MLLLLLPPPLIYIMMNVSFYSTLGRQIPKSVTDLLINKLCYQSDGPHLFVSTRLWMCVQQCDMRNDETKLVSQRLIPCPPRPEQLRFCVVIMTRCMKYLCTLLTKMMTTSKNDANHRLSIL